MIRRLAGVAMVLLLTSGCSMMTFGLLGDDEPDQLRVKGPSVGQMVKRLPELELAQVESRKPTRDEVMAAYNAVYGMLPTAGGNHAVGKRLADLHMDRGQDQDIEGVEAPYSPAVSLYEELLLQQEGAEQIDEILYQLARAYDLHGENQRAFVYLERLINEYPESQYIAEARFRRGEILFSAEDFRAAAVDYTFVVSQGEDTPYLRNATYMLGWAEFKRMRFDEGLHQFFNVVDFLLTDSGATDPVHNELLDDAFRVITLALAYLDGPLTLADEMRRRGKPDWQYLAYEKLAADYFDKERFLDSVATWQTFVEHNSLDIRSPAAHQRMIKILADAGFPSDVVTKKAEFIARYGVYSDFWQHHDETTRETYLPVLREYLDEAAKLAHATAQDFDEDPSNKLKGDARVDARTALFLAAAERYEELVVTFADDPRSAEYLFLLGETYTEGLEHGRAVAAYQQVVREFPEFAQAHEAGYAAILGLTQLVESASPEELELWQRLKIDAQIEFALFFSGDPRAPAVQTDAANALFGLGHLSEAVDLAQNLLAEWPGVDSELRQTALLIIGHGRFEQGDPVGAEVAYRELLNMDLADAARAEVHEKLLASVYQQGEAAESGGDVDTAVGHFLRIAQIDPGAALAASSHFDAIAVLEGADRLADAAALLERFRDMYPKHPLGADSEKRLATMYEATGDTAAAAREYVALAEQDADVDVRRQSLYRAAELYFAMEDLPRAIEHFRTYAHTYKKPRDLRMEAMHHMDLLYQRTGEADKRRFWLNKKIGLHKEMGATAGERATWLAAEAQLVFADDARQRFVAVRLGHPLQKSLKKKRRALKDALKAYEKAAAYQVAEFGAVATFHTGQLYSMLAQSVMNSARPDDLSDLELEQYEILLEEQAFPFEEQAISLHEINMHRAWSGTYNKWVKESFAALARLMPGRFDKPEQEVAHASGIH